MAFNWSEDAPLFDAAGDVESLRGAAVKLHFFPP